MSRRPARLVSHSLADKPDLLWNEYWKRSRTVIEIDPPVKPDAPVKKDAVRFVCISDTHLRFSEMVEENKIPAGDVLLHCGDFTDVGRRDEYIEFNELLGQLPHRFKIVIAGNHDLGCEDGENVERRALGDNTSDLVKEGTEQGYKLLTNCTYLQDSSTEVYGIKIYGSSWHPLKGWSFYCANGPEITAEWRKIPTGIDVLMTHTPPLGHLDQCDVGHVGSADLLDVVEKSVKPKFHVFGHIHEQHGVTTNNVTTFVNLFLVHPSAPKTINNSLKEKPTVKCGPERVEISAPTESNFEGVLFIKNWRYTEGCFTAYEKGSNATKQPTFSLALKDITRCGLELRRAVDARSLELFTVFVVSFHPNFVTMSDRAFAVHCVFQQQEVTVGHKFNFISDITTREVLSGTAETPTPLLTVVTGRTPDPTHSPATTVFVGDPLTFIWHLKHKSEIYGLRVKDCMAETLDGRKMKVIEDGCSSDDVIVSNVKYAENHNSAFADAMSFKFADAEDVWLKCSVDLCIRRQPHLNATSDLLQENFCPDTVECHKRAKRSVEELMSSTLQASDNSFILTSKLNVNERQFVDGNTSRSYESLINETKNGGSWLHSQFCMVKSVLSVGVALVVTLHLAIIAATVLTFCAINRSKHARMISSS